MCITILIEFWFGFPPGLFNQVCGSFDLSDVFVSILPGEVVKILLRVLLGGAEIGVAKVVNVSIVVKWLVSDVWLIEMYVNGQ